MFRNLGFVVAFIALIIIIAVIYLGSVGNTKLTSENNENDGKRTSVEIGQNKKVVIVLDRTTELGGSKEILMEGANSLIRGIDFEGQVEVLEVRDTSIGYKRIGNAIINTLPPEPKPISLESCRTSTGAYIFDGDEKKQKDCRERNIVVTHQHQEQKNRYEAELRAWEKEKTELVDIIKIFASRDNPTTRRTEIRSALSGILSSRCVRANCKLYLFSDFLDSEVKKAVVQNNVSFEKARQLGRTHASEYTSGRGVKKFSVLGWGIGRSDKDADRPLSASQQRLLISYWESFFRELGGEVEYLGYEFPAGSAN